MGGCSRNELEQLDGIYTSGSKAATDHWDARLTWSHTLSSGHTYDIGDWAAIWNWSLNKLAFLQEHILVKLAGQRWWHKNQHGSYYQEQSPIRL